MITGVITNSNKAYKRKVSVNPIPHHYEKLGEKPYIKWSCPVCEAVGNKAQILHGVKNCSLCGVSLNWDRKPKVGDTVIINDWHALPGGIHPVFLEGDRCVIVEDHSDDPKEIPYVLEHKGQRLGCRADVFSILDESEN